MQRSIAIQTPGCRDMKAQVFYGMTDMDVCPATECSRDADVAVVLRGTQGGIESGTKLFGIGSGWHQLSRNLPSIG